MKSKTKYLLKRQDRDGNTVDINVYEEPEIKKIFLSEKKDMYSKGYVLVTQGPVFRACWKQFANALNAGYKIEYYYVIRKQARIPPSEQKDVSKYFYTIAILKERVVLQ